MNSNDLRAPEENFEKKPTGWSGYPPSSAWVDLGSILLILPRHGLNEGIRPSVLKTKCLVHFGARSCIRSFMDNERPLVILYSLPSAVLFLLFHQSMK